MSVTPPWSELTDESLLMRAGTDPQAFEVLYRRHFDKTVGFAARRCNRPDEVHDLVAAIWLDVVKAAPRYDPRRGRALPWILGVGANLVADRRRRTAREREAIRRLAGRRALDDDAVTRVDEAIDALRASQQVLAEVAALPPAERAAVELVALDGMSAARAAEALGTNPAAVRMRIARARDKLRTLMIPDDEVVR